MASRSASTMCCLLLLTGCAGGALRSAGAERPATGEGYRESAELLWDCPRTGASPEEGGSPALLAPLVGIAVDTAVGAVSAMLADAQKARTGSWTASRAIEMGDCQRGTLEIRRGVYHAGRLLDGERGPGGRMTYPAFRLVAEVTIRPGDRGNSPDRIVTLTPVRLDYAETSARSRGSGRKSVTVNIGLVAAGDGPADASANDGAAKAGAMLIDLGKLEVGKVYTGLGVSAAATVPVSAVHNIAVIVTESEDPSVVLKAFSAAFDANKDDLSTALKKAINGE